MLRSFQTGVKSGSNWLNRLRSNKGFPTDDLDLDHCLNNHHHNHNPVPQPSGSPIINASNSNSESSQCDEERVTDRNRAKEFASGNMDTELYGIMTNVLSDLFNMDNPNQNTRFSGKKNARKQTNPKVYVTSTPTTNDIGENSSDSVRKDENVQASAASMNSDNNSDILGTKVEKNVNADCGDVDFEEEEKVSCDRELKGYSRSEVTVIDTSCGVWKSDKWVFRKKNIWKVRDKKSKSWMVGAKKRKGNDLGFGNGNAGAKKKAKVSNLVFGLSKDANGGDPVMPSNDAWKLRNDKSKEVCEEASGDLSQVPKMRFHFSRSLRKSKMNGSSVVLIKSMSLSNNSVRHMTKNCLKETQRQYKI